MLLQRVCDLHFYLASDPKSSASLFDPDLYFTSPNVDLDLISGLCGVWDGNQDNDLTMPDGLISSETGIQVDIFAGSWRLVDQ